jgi:hypothetical protein
MTIGTLPMMIDVVSEKLTCPKASAPSVALRVSGRGEVGADQVVAAELRVHEDQEHEDERPRAH